MKWPNDVLIDGRKVGGILTHVTDVEARPKVVVVGVGVNRVGSSYDFPGDLRGRVITLAEAIGNPPTHDELLYTFVERLRRHVAEWTAKEGRVDSDDFFRRARLGRGVNLDCRPGNFVVSGIDEHGALVVTGEDGQVQVVQAGDVTPVEWQT